jgi:hypothetical protein
MGYCRSRIREYYSAGTVPIKEDAKSKSARRTAINHLLDIAGATLRDPVGYERPDGS